MAAIFPGAVATTLQLLTAINNTKVLLDVNAGIGDTTITVDDASPLPTSGYLTFNDNADAPETIHYTGKSTNDLTGVTRGSDGTSASAHTADGTTALEQRWNADYHNIVTLELVAVETYLSDRFGIGSSPVIPVGKTLTIAATASQVVLGTTRTVTITAPTPASTSRTWTIPDITADGTFASLTGTQTFTGSKTFSVTTTISATTNQIVLGTTNTVTITSPAPASSAVYTIPDVGTVASFVMTAGTQTVAGTKTFSTAPILSSLTATTVPYLDGSKQFVSSAVTPTELGYLTGVTSAIQTQIGTKLGASFLAIRKPNLTWISVTTVDVEVNTGTANQTSIIFPDGETRTVTEDTSSTNKYRRFIITAAAEFTSGTEDSGVRSGISEATNTWYAIYAVKSVIDATKFVLAGDTTEHVFSNYATLNSRYGTNGWVHLGYIRNGDQSGATGDILNFKQTGNMTIFQNIAADAGTSSGLGVRLASTTGTTSLTWNYASGTSGAVVPEAVKIALITGAVNVGSTGAVGMVDGSGTFAFENITGQVSVCVLQFFIPVALGLITTGPASSNHSIKLSGFIDNSLVNVPSYN